MYGISTKPSKAHLRAESRHMTYRSSKSVHSLHRSARDKGTIRKDQERNLTVTGYPPRPSTLLDRIHILTEGSIMGQFSKFQVSLKSDKWFPRCDGSKFAISHWFGHAQLVLPHTVPTQSWYDVVRRGTTCGQCRDCFHLELSAYWTSTVPQPCCIQTSLFALN